MGQHLYVVAVGLFALAYFLGRGSSGGNSLKARNISGNVIVGNVSGPVSQQVSNNGESGGPKGDRVAWIIGILALLVALAQLWNDLQ